MLSRTDVLKKAVDKCIIEMYKWAQPSINLQEYIDNSDLIKETDDDKFYMRYYLSKDNMEYIVQNFINAYHIGNDWHNNIKLLVDYITSKDSVREKYIPGENGFPGYMGYEPITPLQDITKDSAQVLNLIQTCREFYRKDPETSSFNMSVYLGASPYSNKERVEKYWREHGMPDFKIIDFNIDDIIYGEEYSEEWIKNNLVHG